MFLARILPFFKNSAGGPDDPPRKRLGSLTRSLRSESEEVLEVLAPPPILDMGESEPCVALYGYKPRHEHDVELTENSTVHVFEKADEEGNTEWWKVRTEEGVEGYVPATYLYIIPPEPVQDYEYAEGFEINPDLICPACKRVLSHPVLHTTCGCVVCARCLFLADKKCPKCKEVVNWSRETQDASQEFLDRLGAIHVKCPDCDHTCPKHFVQQHRDQYCYIDCPEGCGVRATRTDMEKHVSDECPKVEIPCSAQVVGCEKRCLRSEIEAHERDCPFVTLQPILMDHHEQILSLTTQIQMLNGRLEDLTGRLSKLEQAAMVSAKEAALRERRRGPRRRPQSSFSSSPETVEATYIS
eukprot:comp44088_c0_seq1/m.47498 comp44088_c0_seq1/g.47498  ORF comp44088_c0_seq1/g.47498 comp44088_c0_seq1/m.47498 type:complete len:356 (-) comp44088_c0_seq1:102-1169(-)